MLREDTLGGREMDRKGRLEGDSGPTETGREGERKHGDGHLVPGTMGSRVFLC